MKMFDESAFLQDELKTNLSPYDLFDKIINLKLTVSAKDVNNGNINIVKDEYVIRSDYETYIPDYISAVARSNTPDLNTCVIRKCQQKPSIKVQYKQISNGTAIEIDIYVSNFAMLDAYGRTLLNFNNANYPLTKVEVMMGYWGQFKDIPHETVKDLFDFTPRFGARSITCTVDYVQTDQLPPDSVMHIHGYVGNSFGSAVSELGASDVTYEELKQNKTDAGIKSFLFENITRKYLKTPTISAEDNIKVDSKTAKMDVDSANKFGVQVFCSDKLLAYDKEHQKDHQIIKDSSGNDVTNEVIGFTGVNIVNTLNQLRDFMGYPVCFKPLNDGNYIAFLEDESDDAESIANNFSSLKETLVDSYWKNKIPAVSNITVDALCTIVCPFFYFVDPFDKLMFASRYALGGVVSYYADFTVKEDTFYALWQTVTFATVDDINECQIVCTGSKSNK